MLVKIPFHAALAYLYCLAYDFGIIHNDQTLPMAENLANRALIQKPELSLALNAMGYVRYKRGDIQEAVKYYVRAENIDHNNDALLWLGIALTMVGKIDQAQYYSREAIFRDPLTFEAHFPYNMTLLFTGHFDESISLFENDINQFAPDEPFAEWWLAQAYAFGGRDSDAITLFESVGKKEGRSTLPFVKSVCLCSKE